MERLKLFLFVFLISTNFILGQNTDKETPPPRPTQTYLYNLFEKTLEVLRVKVVEGNITVESDTILFATREFSRDSLSVSSEIDTIRPPAGTSKWWVFDIANVGDTLIQFGVDGTFTSRHQLAPGQFYYSDVKLNINAFPELYIRRKSTLSNGTCYYDITIYGY